LQLIIFRVFGVQHFVVYKLENFASFILKTHTCGSQGRENTI